MNELPRRKLREIVARDGREVVRDGRRVEGLLRDHCGEYRREISALVSALEEHVPQDLLAAQAAAPREALLARLARRLSDNRALAEGPAAWAANSWALALGVVSDNELEAIEGRTQAGESRPGAAVLQSSPAAADATPKAGGAAASAAGAAPSGRGGSGQAVSGGQAGRARPSRTSASGELVVSAQGGGDCAGIGEALRRAAPGARVVVRPGVYTEGLVIGAPVEIVGEGRREEVVITSDAASCVLMSAGRASLAGVTIRGRAAGSFAVEVAGGELLLEDCDITSETLSCVAAHGRGSAATLRRCRVRDGADSGLYFFDGAAATVEECEVHGHANVCVAVAAGAEVSVARSRIYDGRNAGAAVWDDGAADFDACEVRGNRLAGLGVSRGGRLAARACRLRGGANSGVYVHEGGDATLEACDINGHREAEVAVESRGQLTALGCEIHGGHGPGVFVREGGQALVQGCVVSENAGAGVVVGAGSLAAVIGCRVNRNGGAGVRVEADGAARVTESDLSANTLGPWDAEDGAHLEGGDNEE